MSGLMLNLLRDRDANASIRGFVYQVDLIILRWIGLKPDQVLELERGEDIDLLSRALSAEDDNWQRLLEQVKALHAPISLRSQVAVEAIASFIEHQHANPSLELLYRFTTTAAVAREQVSPMPEGRAAIGVWNGIRAGEIAGAARDAALTAIRNLLQQAGKPKRLNANTWRIYRQFVDSATDDDVLRLVLHLDWSMGGAPPDSLPEEIEQALIGRSHATDATEAQQRYRHLFLHVFRLLARDGIKRLAAADLAQVLVHPSLTQADHQLLIRMDEWRRVVDATLAQHATQIQAIHDQLARFDPLGAEAAFTYVAATPLLDVPAPVAHLGRREETVSALLHEIDSHVWLALCGDVGRGKTQLAILAAQAIGMSRGWVRLRDLSPELACLRIDEALVSLSGVPRRGSETWYYEACSQLDGRSLLVLDDLPRLDGGGELAERLIHLARACGPHQVRMLSTSHHRIPPAIRDALGDMTFAEVSAPHLTDTEAREILSCFGSPALPARTVGFLNGLADGHPVLLVAMAEYLRGKSWLFSEESIDGIFRGEYTERITTDTVRRILATVQDESSRELLYRLSLALRAFGPDTIPQIASVVPPLPRPREHFSELTGLWVQADGTDRYVISPLVRPLGDTELSQDTRHGCHRMFAQLLVRRKQLSPFEVANAIAHYASGDAYESAVALLCKILSDMHTKGVTRDPAGLLNLLWEAPVRPEVDLTLRLLLRAHQITLGPAFGKDLSQPIADLASLLPHISDESVAGVLAVAIMPQPVLFQHRPDLSIGYALAALQMLSGADSLTQQAVVLPRGERLETAIVWFPLAAIRTRAHLQEWLRLLECLTPEQRAVAFSDPLAEDGCLFVPSAPVAEESANPEGHQDWARALEAITDTADRARTLGLELLWANAVCEAINLVSERQSDHDGALALARRALSPIPTDVRSRFLIDETTGRMLTNAGRHAEAREWLQRALEHATDAYPVERVFALSCLSRALGPSEADVAVTHLERAVSIVDETEAMPWTSSVQVRGELAIAQWMAGNRAQCFDAMEGAAELLLSPNRTASDEWKGLLACYGHVSGYFSSMAALGHPPDSLREGEPYLAPQLGMFLRDRSDLAGLYDEGLEALLPVQLAMFAAANGRDERVVYWALRSLAMVRPGCQSIALPVAVKCIAPHLLGEGRFGELLDMAIDAGRIMVALPGLGKPLDRTVYTSLSVSALLDEQGSDARVLAEHAGAMLGLVPIAFRLATLAAVESVDVDALVRDAAEWCLRASKASVSEGFWASAAELLRSVFIWRDSAPILRKQAQAFREREQDALEITAYLGASIQRKTGVGDAASAMIYAVGRAERTYGATSMVYRKVVTPFVCRFWSLRFERARVHFTPPDIVEQMLRTAKSAPEESRARSVLSVVVFGLHLDPPADVRDWLANGF